MKLTLRTITAIIAVFVFVPSFAADSAREKILINNGWTFSLGDASDRSGDFAHGAEYFTYLTKVMSNNGSRSPIRKDFDDSSWQTVSLPHDWVVDLPFSSEASHSHGYKCVGWKYPEYSVGWYRKHLFIPEEDKGKRILVEFEGIFRDSEVFCNGIYMGHERSGYASRVYDMTEYLDYGADNVITVRADASLEEGWFYEGAGIYRNVYLHKTAKTAVSPYGVRLREYRFTPDRSSCTVVSDVVLDPLSDVKTDIIVAQSLIDAEGKSVGTAFSFENGGTMEIPVQAPVLWSIENPYLYTLRTCVYKSDCTIENLLDEYDVRIGIRSIDFDPEKGFLLNGYRVELKGCDLHQDHAGVGAGIPDELWRYRILQLKKYGFNAIRSSHNPASPAMLDLCDELGMVVIDENRCMGIDEEHFDLMRRMIHRDVNHPSVILWSIGNEEWAVEYSPKGYDIATRMVDFVHSLDASRPVTYGNCSGHELVKALDVFGYNYIVQNPIEEFHKSFPERTAVGTEETTGCGTRGKYLTEAENGWMVSLNRSGVDPDPVNGSDAGMQTTSDGHILNVIERGWKYYAARPWLGGLFYWTGFDYRGEPTPFSWPATGSQFGILDYCGFPKDEAYYLQSCWTSEPMVYASPDWNRQGSEGQYVDVWVYSNCDEVQLLVNGVSQGRKTMPQYGHISWPVKYKAGKLEVRGYRNGRRAASFVSATSGKPVKFVATQSKKTLLPDGQDVAVIDLAILDEMGREVTTSDQPLSLSASSNLQILGWGNGDPAFQVLERPASGDKGSLAVSTFAGKVQILVRSVENASGMATLSVKGLQGETILFNY